MNKVELIAAVAVKLEVSKKEASVIIETVVNTIVDGAKGGECVIPGLGKLVTAKTAARAGTSKGVAWSKPAGETLKLRLSKAGKEIL
ncbi:MAG: HU family DNA-binding protein [Sulfuricurvum sp.]